MTGGQTFLLAPVRAARLVTRHLSLITRHFPRPSALPNDVTFVTFSPNHISETELSKNIDPTHFPLRDETKSFDPVDARICPF